MKNNSNDIYRIIKQPQVAIKCVNIVFLFGIIISIFIAIFAIYKSYKMYAIFNYSNYTIISLIFAALFGLGFRLRNDLKINVSLLLCSVMIIVFTFEICLYYLPTMMIEKKLEVSFDNRTRSEVIDSLRVSSKKVYPNILPASFININGLSNSNGIIYPIGGISNAITVDCNETGHWSIYKADEHGFNNPKGLYSSNNVDIILTGDSMAQGQCVNHDENIGSWIRKSGFHTINLGKGASGPLIEYAALIEYAKPIKPKTVLWVFSENDITDLRNELNSMFLRNYLDNSYYSQNLILRQNEINSLLKIFYQNNLEIKKSTMIKNKLIQTVKLTNIRSFLNVSPKLKTNPAVFKNIFSRAKELVSSWGGELYFVFIPSKSSISNTKKYPYKEKILNFISEESIPIIDIQKEVILMHPDPLSLFPYKKAIHFNSKGYRLIGEAITKRLKADGIIPLNSTN